MSDPSRDPNVAVEFVDVLTVTSAAAALTIDRAATRPNTDR